MEKPYECDVKKRDGRKLDHLHFLSRRKRTLICVHAQLLLRACARLPQWCLTLCDPTVCSTPGSPIRGNFQQEYWSGLVFPPPGNLPDPGIQSASPALAGRFFTTEPPEKWKWKSLRLSPVRLCNCMEYTVHGILRARIPKWVAFPFSRGSSQPRDQTQVSRIAGRFFTSWATRKALFNIRSCLKVSSLTGENYIDFSYFTFSIYLKRSQFYKYVIILQMSYTSEPRHTAYP